MDNSPYYNISFKQAIFGKNEEIKLLASILKKKLLNYLHKNSNFCHDFCSVFNQPSLTHKTYTSSCTALLTHYPQKFFLRTKINYLYRGLRAEESDHGMTAGATQTAHRPRILPIGTRQLGDKPTPPRARRLYRHFFEKHQQCTTIVCERL